MLQASNTDKIRKMKKFMVFWAEFYKFEMF